MHASICDQLLDLVQNAIEAGATEITVKWREAASWQELSVSDNGCGMSVETQSKALDPFYTDGRKHKHRRVGLGLAFLRQMVEDTGGRWELVSEVGRGTEVRFRLERAHPDVPPPGDLAGAVGALMMFPGDYELRFIRETEAGEYRLTRSSLREALGDLETSASLVLMQEYIASQEEALQKG